MARHYGIVEFSGDQVVHFREQMSQNEVLLVS